MQDTIAAIATPPGEGALHVIRLSGPATRALLDRVFALPGRDRPHAFVPRHATQGEVRDPATGAAIDSVLATFYEGPASYTGEDSAEISCHGGVLVSRQVLSVLLDQGARLAEPGEFTRRAFINGKLDLTQAEAVADLIHAASDRARASALDQLKGRLSDALDGYYTDLIGVLSQLETAIDFPEEGLEFERKQALKESVERVMHAMQTLAGTFHQGKIIREGLKVALVGKPNVGKSSLLNALLREDRAIVTPYPGTTRDVLEERIRLNDLHLNILDTAGIRHDPEKIEEEGIARTLKTLEQADLALVLFDGSAPLDDNDRRLAGLVEGRAALAVINKNDRPQAWPADQLPEPLRNAALRLSVKEEAGLDALRERLYAFAGVAELPPDMLIVTRERHHRALLATLEALERVGRSLAENRSEDLIAVDLNDALETLGGLTGRAFASDLLDRIFDDFCIGK